MIARRLLWLVDQYQRAFEGRPSPCRFFPSCSEYAREALTVHGAGRGTWLTVRRLSRCRPLGPSGFDPVPEPRPTARTFGQHGDHTHSGGPRDSCCGSPAAPRPPAGLSPTKVS